MKKINRPDMENLALTVSDMQTKHCITRAKHTLRKIPGTEILKIVPGQVLLRFDDAHIHEHDILDALIEEGFTPEKNL